MTQPVFVATALIKTYVSGEIQVHALNNVDLEVVEKEVVVLLAVGSHRSLEETSYHERYSSADVFALVKRAPKALVDQIAQIPGEPRSMHASRISHCLTCPVSRN